MPKPPSIASAHAEVLAALRAIGNPQRGEAIRLDRGSALPHLGIGFPALRERVKQGFSFSSLPFDPQLKLWSGVWNIATHGDVLFAAIEFLAPVVRGKAGMPEGLWPQIAPWSARVDNWCHSDALSAIYSRVLQADVAAVLPSLQVWSASENEWLRRLSITSLIHGAAKKDAVFLSAAQMQPLLQRAVPDHRRYIQLALGWVLREWRRARPQEAARFMQQHAAAMGAIAKRRAMEA
jgi:hypothetical protein